MGGPSQFSDRHGVVEHFAEAPKERDLTNLHSVTLLLKIYVSGVLRFCDGISPWHSFLGSTTHSTALQYRISD